MPNKATLNEIANYGNLLIAHANAKRGKTHYRAVKEFEMRKDELLRDLQESLLSGNYRTSRYKTKVIMDSGKERLIAKLPYYPDRIAHWAVMLILEPIFLEQFSTRTHAAIPNRGIHTALYQTRKILLQKPKKSQYCLKLDIKKYFPHIDHKVLKEKIRGLTDDDALIRHLEENIDSYDSGIPIGNYTSQYWANYYLTDMDLWLESLGGEFVRYMDDIVIFGESKPYLRNLFVMIQDYLSRRLKVQIKDNWQIYPVDNHSRGVDFVGYRIFRNRVILRKSTFRKMRRTLAKVRKHLINGIFTERDRSRIASYAGWVKYCTPKARAVLYEKYFKELLGSIHGNTKFKLKIMEKFK